MTYKGVIIEESLTDTSVLKDVRILSTEIEKVTDRHQTPWVKQWTLHNVEIPENNAAQVANKISLALDKPHDWYADFKTEKEHYIIYSDKIFHITDRSQKAQYDEAAKYGLLLGIPDYQVDFSSHIVWRVADIVIVKEGKVLLVQQQKESAKGLWSYPGGHIEDGETPKEAVIREVMEEIGVELINPVFLKTYSVTIPSGPLELNTFVGSIDGQSIVLEEDELMAYDWFSLDELESKTDLRGDIVIDQARDALAEYNR